ncbi:MAG: hypothetical protein WBA39_29520 [Rivularia sp. (in: cyanobacteria)]
MYSFDQLAKVLGISPERALKVFQDIESFFEKEFGTIPEIIDINSLLTDDQAELIEVGVSNELGLESLLGRI